MYTCIDAVINIHIKYFNFSNADDEIEVHSAVCKLNAHIWLYLHEWPSTVCIWFILISSHTNRERERERAFLKF
jgi:hypothetical protein